MEQPGESLVAKPQSALFAPKLNLENVQLLFDLDEDVLSAAYSAQIAAAADDNEELEDYLIDNESDFSQINIEL